MGQLAPPPTLGGKVSIHIGDSEYISNKVTHHEGVLHKL